MNEKYARDVNRSILISLVLGELASSLFTRSLASAHEAASVVFHIFAPLRDQ
jgi:hypothetical protein